MSDEGTTTEVDHDLGLVDDNADASATEKPSKGKKPKGPKAAKPAKADTPDAEIPTIDPLAAAPPSRPADDLREEEAPHEPRRRAIPTWLAIVSAVIAVALIVTTALAVIQWRRANDLRSDRNAAAAAEHDRQDAAMIASKFTEALLTYDYNNLDVSRQNVIAVSTKEFADKYGPAFQQGLQPVLTETQSIATASIRTVYMGDVSENTATAVTIADQTVESNTQSLKKIGSYFKLELTRVDGAWKVANVTVLGVESADSTDKPADGSASTTTTLPVPAP